MSTPIMTDDKVKEAAEPSRYHLTEPTILLHTAEGARSFGEGWLLISEDEYAKLSAEVERLREERDDFRIQANSLLASLKRVAGEHEAAEAKLTALVEAAAGGALTSESVGHPDAEQRRASVSLTWFGAHSLERMQGAWDALRQALAHHSAPVGDDECPRCGSSAPHLHPAVQMEGEVETCTHDFHLTPTSQNTPKYVAAVEAKRAASAPPTTPTSAPVEDVAGLGRDTTKLDATALTDAELIVEQTRVEKLWDSMFEPDENGEVFEGHGGSPGEWMQERMMEIAQEQLRRAALQSKEAIAP